MADKEEVKTVEIVKTKEQDGVDKLKNEVQELKILLKHFANQQQEKKPEEVKVVHDLTYHDSPQLQEERNEKTDRQLRQAAMEELVKQRDQYVNDALFGNSKHGVLMKNATKELDFYETILLNIYEDSEDSFQKLIAYKMEPLKKRDYGKLLEQDMEEIRNLRRFHKKVERGQDLPMTEKQVMLENLGRQIIINQITRS